jgi:hypothetical protein
MAISGHNGNNESLIGVSNSIGLSFYDENNNEIPIKDSYIEIKIKRDSNLPDIPFQYVNATQFELKSQFLQNAFNVTAMNASIHIELMPLDVNIGYIIVLKKGSPPLINKTYANYDAFKIICPSNCLFKFFRAY